MEDETKTYVLKEEVSRSNIRRLSSLTPDDRMTILSLIVHSNWARTVERILTFLDEISRRNRCPAKEIVQRSEISSHSVSKGDDAISENRAHQKGAYGSPLSQDASIGEWVWRTKKKASIYLLIYSFIIPLFLREGGLKAEFQFETIEEYRSIVSFLSNLAGEGGVSRDSAEHLIPPEFPCLPAPCRRGRGRQVDKRGEDNNPPRLPLILRGVGRG